MKQLLYLLLVPTLFFFCPLAIPGIDTGFLATGRFVAVGAVCIFMFAAENVGWLLRTPRVDWPLGAMLLYMLLSTQWSESPRLTLYKTLGYALVSIVFVNVGSYLGEKQKDENPFALLAPLYLAAVVSSVVALAVSPGSAMIEGKLFGYTANPNYLGAMIAFSSPWIVHYLGFHWDDVRHRWLAVSLGVLGLAVLVATRSRTSLAMTMVICFVASAGRRSRARFIPLVGIALVLIYIAGGFELIRGFIYKDYDSVFQSRTSTWGPSIEAAEAGGVFGIGFGVSYGLSQDWDGELQTGGAGREKGHSQLAIIEEVGLVGLIGYAILLGGMAKAFVRLPQGALPAQELTRKIAGGFLLGSVVHSALEGWFTSPGSPETAMFWIVMGLGLGGIRLPRGFAKRLIYSANPKGAATGRICSPAQ